MKPVGRPASAHLAAAKLLAVLLFWAAAASSSCSHLPAAAGQSAAGRLLLLDALGRQLKLLPGLLDETLLTRGSFEFGASRVRFDKLKVLGNVYVNKVNGRPLRQSYLLRSSLNKRDQLPAPADLKAQTETTQLGEQIVLQILDPPQPAANLLFERQNSAS